jgi:peptide/nickel transport system permease protein
MSTYIIRRVLTAIPTLIAISIILFTIINLAPGDPLASFAADPRVPESVKENIRKQLGLSDPGPIRYVKWATSMVRGDWGNSFQSRSSVGDLIKQRFVPTLQVGGVSFLLALLIAIPIGITAAIKQYSVFDQISTVFAYLGNALPTFVSGILLILVFGVQLRWFPFIYRSNLESTGIAAIGERIHQIALPVLVLALVETAALMRYTRASMLEVIKQDYVRTARAKGLTEGNVIVKHAVRNALIPVATIVALRIPILFGGFIVTEQIFRIPGTGSLFISAFYNKDVPVLMALTFIYAVLVVACSLVVDILYGVLDPRIKYT